MDLQTYEICQAAKGGFDAAGSLFTRDAGLYLAHCLGGVSIRRAAQAIGAAPSTVSRAVRRVEALRDDPLMDVAFDQFEAAFAARDHESQPKEIDMPKDVRPTKQEINALVRLTEPEAFLMVAKGADKAGVFCRTNNFRRPLMMAPLAVASRMLTHDWITCFGKSELSAKYKITDAGRALLKRCDAERPSRETGFAEAPTAFAAQHRLNGARTVSNPTTGELETIQVNLGESPLGWLSRRRDASGQPLLTAVEVEAGERLREDYEMAQIGPKLGQDWRRFLTPAQTSGGPGRTPSEGPMFARDRVAKALDVLGPGLSDAAIRICCFLEGLEATERRMGWSARSGKVVLKLALQRLVDHYGLAIGERAA
ncbi:MAG: DUF6456 domain-containing protein [Pseudomonadota bacterium]